MRLPTGQDWLEAQVSVSETDAVWTVGQSPSSWPSVSEPASCWL